MNVDFHEAEILLISLRYLEKNWVFERVEAGKQALFSLSFKTSTTCGVLPFKTGSFLKWVPPPLRNTPKCACLSPTGMYLFCWGPNNRPGDVTFEKMNSVRRGQNVIQTSFTEY